MRSTSRCRSCRAEIFWAIAQATNKRMPMDVLATPNGNCWIVGYEDRTPVIAVAATPDEVPTAEALRYRSHFVTCPEAGTWRRRN